MQCLLWVFWRKLSCYKEVDLVLYFHYHCIIRVWRSIWDSHPYDSHHVLRQRSSPYFIKSPEWISLRWRHNGCDSVSNHQPRECLLRRLIRRTSKKTSKLRVTGLCAGNSPETGEFPAQMASNAENVSIWWRHHVLEMYWHLPFYCIISVWCTIRSVTIHVILFIFFET